MKSFNNYIKKAKDINVYKESYGEDINEKLIPIMKLKNYLTENKIEIYGVQHNYIETKDHTISVNDFNRYTVVRNNDQELKIIVENIKLNDVLEYILLEDDSHLSINQKINKILNENSENKAKEIYSLFIEHSITSKTAIKNVLNLFEISPKLKSEIKKYF